MTRIEGLGMDDYEPTRRLFAVRIHPESAPHVIVALLAGSAAEAEIIAREKTRSGSAPATVHECGPDDVTVVTFR